MSLSPATHVLSSYRAKSLQLMAAVPSAMLWLLLASLSSVWLTGFALSEARGNSINDWRGPYLMLLCALALATALFEGALFLKAIQGRSRIWWHLAMAATAVLFVALMGIVGD